MVVSVLMLVELVAGKGSECGGVGSVGSVSIVGGVVGGVVSGGV